LSLALQPPLPLHEFWPLQACFSFTVFWSWDWSCALNEDFSPGKRFDAWIVAPLPASRPASAAPAIKAFFDFVILLKFLLSKDCDQQHVLASSSTMKIVGD
jgi:hypothetical protein